MTSSGSRIFLTLVLAIAAAASVHVQQPPGPSSRSEKIEHYSPLAFEDLRAFELAYPGVPGSVAVVRAAALKYWVFQGVAYRGSTAQGAAWTSLGPLTTVVDPNAGSSSNFSGRIAALAISPSCELEGPCRMWIGAAGGGVWRTDAAMNTDDAGWRWIGQGLGTNSIGSL